MAVAAVVVAAALVGLARPGLARADWETWGDGSLRHGQALESSLRAANARTLRLAWSRPLGGTGAAQPLAVTVPGVPGRMLLAASESGRVTAFAEANGATLWRRELGAMSTNCQQLPGGSFGVTGTPVYDPARAAVYLETTGKVFALDARTGATLPGWPLTLPIDPFYEPVWGALALNGTNLYLATASYCDRRPYTGRVLRIDTATPAVAGQWVTVPSTRPGGGGIWGWGGVALTPDGHVWVATANANAPSITDDGTEHAESIIELSPELQLLQESKATGMPVHGDYGFGSTPIVFHPTGCPVLVAAEGKDGVLFLWRRTTLGRGPVQKLKLAYPSTLYGSPAWDAATQRLFLTTSTGFAGVPRGLQALAVVRPACTLARVFTLGLGMQLDSVPTIANDTAIVATGAGRLVVASTRTRRRLANLPLGAPAFAAPMAIGRDVVVPTWNGFLRVFRLAPRRH